VYRFLDVRISSPITGTVCFSFSLFSPGNIKSVSYVQEVVALQIMRANYEQLVKAHQRAPQVPEDLVPDETKFQVKIKLIFTECF
jgi:hypothetical protein